MVNFKKSWDNLFKNLGLVIPPLIKVVIFLIFFIIVFIIAFAGIIGAVGLQDVAFSSLSTLKSMILPLLIIIGVVGFLLALFVGTILDTLLYSFAREVAKGKKPQYRKWTTFLKQSYWRFIGYKVMSAIILILVAIVFIALFILAYFLTNSSPLWSKVLIFAILIVLAVIALIYLILGFLFAPTILFLKKLSILDTIRESFAFLRAHAGLVVLAFLIIIGVSIGASLILSVIPIIGGILSFIAGLFLTAWGTVYLFRIFLSKKL